TSTLDPYFRPYADYLVGVGRKYLGRVVVTSTRRSWAEQARMYSDWLAGHRVLPVDPPERSMHVRGLALDLVIGDYRAGDPPSREMQALGEWWQSAGGRWGGKRDPVHFSA